MKLEVRSTLAGHGREIKSITGFRLGDRQYLASGGADRTVRIWDLQDDQEVGTLVGHTGTVNVVTSLTFEGQAYLISGGSDRTLRVWDPASATTVLSIPLYHPVLDCTCVGLTVATALSAGVLALDLHAAGLQHRPEHRRRG
ncbi:hypothetical protein [Dactylosporangium sp. CA-139066]|uniref:hypothetical protein n=1 Tax=Dactylosporangium sp. CA-139066 TaxID=3239930 RepID=UPI003D8AF12B